MSDAKSPPSKSLLRRLFTLKSAATLVFVVLAILLPFVEWFSEYWLATGIAMFAPAQLLVLPPALIAICALVRKKWRLLAACLAICSFVLGPFMGYRIRLRSQDAVSAFSVITHNIGQGNRGAFADSFADERPDAVLLQDVFNANRRERDYIRRYPAYNSRGLGQFILLSPHEITGASLVLDSLWRGQAVAARFVVRADQREIALYSVHMPTPRDPLSAAIGPGVLLEIFGIRDARAGRFDSYREWMDARVQLARQLAAVFEKETLPFIVGGDFNTPDHGVIYHVMASRMTDAHSAAGRGWGFTFPGRRDNKLAAIIGHWLRLDYLFAGRGFVPIECIVADDDTSQHRAVLARFKPAP